MDSITFWLLVFYSIPALLTFMNGIGLLLLTYSFIKITGGMKNEDWLILIKVFFMMLGVSIFWLPILIYTNIRRYL